MAEWRDLPGYEGLYQISISTKEGKCRKLNYRGTGEPRELTTKPAKPDYRIKWTLTKNGSETTYQAARWIALAYPELVDGEYFEGAVIDHKDTDILNNHPSNLKWTTYKGNANNPITKKRVSENQTNRPDQSMMVTQLTPQEDVIAHYPSLNQASRETGIDQSHISKCCRGLRKYAGGFIWRYVGQV